MAVNRVQLIKDQWVKVADATLTQFTAQYQPGPIPEPAPHRRTSAVVLFRFEGPPAPSDTDKVGLWLCERDSVTRKDGTGDLHVMGEGYCSVST